MVTFVQKTNVTYILAFHNSRLIRQIEQEKIYKRFRELDQGLNQGYLLSSTPVEVKNTGISGLTKINRHPGLFVSFMSEPILQNQWRIQGSGARDARPLSVQILSFSCSFGKTFAKQECIPVGCVPSAAVAQRGCLPGGCLPRECLPRGCLPRMCLSSGVVYPSMHWGRHLPCGQNS